MSSREGETSGFCTIRGVRYRTETELFASLAIPGLLATVRFIDQFHSSLTVEIFSEFQSVFMILCKNTPGLGHNSLRQNTTRICSIGI